MIALPVKERALVVNAVLQSLNPPQSAIDKQWSKVAQQNPHITPKIIKYDDLLFNTNIQTR